MRFVSYNILDGGLGRLDPIYETLLYLDADLVALLEADDERGVRYLAEKLHMEHVVAQSAHSPHHVALLSRRPIQRLVNLTLRFTEMQKPALEAVVDFAGAPLRIVAAHLPAHFDHEDDRLRDLLPVLDALDQEPMPTVMMGDFNATAPYHTLDMAALKPKRRQRLESIGGKPRHDVVNAIISRGDVDALHHLHPHHPKQTFTTGYPANRVDYIFLTTDLVARLKAADVETGGFAPYCSDHYPVWADLDES